MIPETNLISDFRNIEAGLLQELQGLVEADGTDVPGGSLPGERLKFAVHLHTADADGMAHLCYAEGFIVDIFF